MANLIDISYFVGEIEIPNTNQPEIKADVEHSIKLYEAEVLTHLLGYKMYKELQTVTVVTGDKWDKLINGEEFSYTPNGSPEVTAKWEGLKGKDKKSLIAYYIYFMHRRKRASYNAGVNIEVEAKTDNSIQASLYTKLTETWNEFIAMYGKIDCWNSWHHFIYAVPADPLNYQYPYSYWNEYPASAFNYLIAKQADFPDWRFTSEGGEINRYGL